MADLCSQLGLIEVVTLLARLQAYGAFQSYHVGDDLDIQGCPSPKTRWSLVSGLRVDGALG